jgi:hypothetical protein
MPCTQNDEVMKIGAGRAAPEKWDARTDRRGASKIERRVDLVAGPNDIAEVDQVVADKGAHAET